MVPCPDMPGTLTLITSPPVTSYTLSPLRFFDAQSDGLLPVSCGERPLPHDGRQHHRSSSPLIRFVRTADGEAIAALKEDGTVEIWTMNKNQRIPEQLTVLKSDSAHKVDRVVVLNGGMYCDNLAVFIIFHFILQGEHIITYCESLNNVSLYATKSMSHPVSVEIARIVSLFSIASGMNGGSAMLIGITARSTVILLNVSFSSHPSENTEAPIKLSIHSECSLPLETGLAMIVPVDPMGWSGPYANQMRGDHDDLVSVSTEGELAFWRMDSSGLTVNWRCTGKVKTQRQNIAMAACSSAKKTVLGKSVSRMPQRH
jgi:hypothetical protein